MTDSLYISRSSCSKSSTQASQECDSSSVEETQETRTIEDKKLWIGNIDKRLTEYNLLKILQQYGEVKKFEYLFHKAGPHRGEPRGYCFVEYSSIEAAQATLAKLNGKLALSKKLAVDWAHKHQDNMDKCSKPELRAADDVKKTVSRECKISAIEAKLKMMSKKDYDEETVVQGKHPLLVQTEQKTKRPHPYKHPHSRHRQSHKYK